MYNKIFFKLAIFVFTMCVFELSEAMPNISSVSEVVNEGKAVVAGSGFGNKSVAAPLKYDFFEQNGSEHNIGNKIQNGWISGDSISSSYNNSIYDSSNPKTASTKYIRTEWSSEDSERDSHCPIYYDHKAPLNEIYVSFYVRFKIAGFSTGAPNAKWFRVVHKTDPFYGSLSPSFVSSFTIYDNQESRNHKMLSHKSGLRGFSGSIPDTTDYHTLPVDNGWDNYVPTPSSDVWVRCEYILKESSATGGVFNGTADGFVRVYYQMGGIGNKFTKVYDQTGIITNQSGNNQHWEAIRFSEYNRDELIDMTIDYDDVYIDNTQARIEIGDNAVWENCTHREIQIPTAWSDTSIEFNVNMGSFSDGNAFLFVVDSTGAVSPGKPIVIGGITGLFPPAPDAEIIK